MGRFGFLGARIVQLIPVAVGVSIITFFLVRLLPGDPAIAILGSHYTPTLAAKLDASLGLSQPVWVQYGYFIGNLLHANLGTSIYYDQPVSSIIGERLPATLFLVLYGAALAALISVPVAVIAALGKDGVFDQISRVVFLVAFAMPGFWVGLIFILIFSLALHWFPVSGYGTSFFAHLWYLFLPALTIALGFSTVLVRTLRASVLAVLAADYVDTARIKGINRFDVLRAHVLRNAILSVVTVFGINLAFLISGTVIVENVFAIPGVGQLLIASVSARDYPMVQGITLIFSLLIISINLLTDVVYASLDPRIIY